jgi:hypothetical protein
MALFQFAGLLGCASSEPQIEYSVDRRDWEPAEGITGIQYLTDHYNIRVTSRDPMLQEYVPGFMEGCFAAYSGIMPPVREQPKKLDIYLFGNRAEWARFTQAFRPMQADTYLHIQSGGYMDQATGTSVVWDIRRDLTLSLLAHEGWHAYLARYFPTMVPAWLNEGLATQFEAFDLRGDYPVFTPKKNYLRRNSLREALTVPDGLVPTRKLLAMHAGQAVVETGQVSRGYYAQVWSLVYMLQNHDGYHEAFDALLVDAGTERLRQAISAYRATTPDSGDLTDGEVLFMHYITDDLEAFDADYEAFCRGLVG